MCIANTSQPPSLRRTSRTRSLAQLASPRALSSASSSAAATAPSSTAGLSSPPPEDPEDDDEEDPEPMSYPSGSMLATSRYATSSLSMPQVSTGSSPPPAAR